MQQKKIKCILVGGSAGSGPLIKQILRNMPENFTIPLIIIRHISIDERELSSGEILSEIYSINVKEPADKEQIQDSTIYVAPAGYHLMLEEEGTFAMSLDAKIHYCRPSIDVLFESAAYAFGPSVAAILLSGANSDGAKGLKKINDFGGVTVIQDPVTAQFPSMPYSALEETVVDHIYAIDQIIDLIVKLNGIERKRGTF